MTTRTKAILSAVPIAILLVLIGFYYLFPETIFTLLIKTERAAAGLDERHIRVGGLDFAYLEGGKGEPLVLLHGFGANKDHWTRMGKYLTPHFRVIAPDLTGFGESSSAPDGDYTIRTQVRRMSAFLRAMDIASFHLGGSSMGGHIAGVYAAAYPQQVKTLLLLAPGGVVSAQPSDMARRMMAGGSNPLLAENIADFRRTLDFVFYREPFLPRPIKKVLLRKALDRQALYAAIFEQIRDAWQREPLEDVLQGLGVPTLIIWGARDRVLHVSGAAVLAAVIPEAELAVMRAVGHLPMIEKPRETAEVYRNWLKNTQYTPF